MKKIFVNLAAYCEPHLAFTLDQIFGKLSMKNGVTVGLVNQTREPFFTPWMNRPYHVGIRCITVNPAESRGAGWARNVAQSLFRDEDYYLQVDSHTLFEQDWDEKLIRLLDDARRLSAKPILSTYPVPFNFDENGVAVKDVVNMEENNILYMQPLNDTKITDDNVSITFAADYIKATYHLAHGFHLAGGFIFCDGDFVNQVPYDPQLYFLGEEQTLAARAYTHGWDILHPCHTKIPLAHLYKKNGADYTEHHWHESHDAKRSEKWYDLNNMSIRRINALLREQRSLGAYGLGNVRTLKQFAEFSGIDYANLTVTRKYNP